jgi:peptidoglycan/xylan/chitin deacetylase (PgdA/CDA1 family)
VRHAKIQLVSTMTAIALALLLLVVGCTRNPDAPVLAIVPEAKTGLQVLTTEMTSPLPPSVAVRQDDAEAVEPSDFWVAAHRATHLWDGPEGDAPSLGRLPVGSYFRTRGPATPERLPVSYSGNSTLSARNGWVDLADIGPIGAPGADWAQPDWPVRRLVLGQRGELVRGDPALPLIALTFDAGAGDGAVRQLLNVLRDRGVKSTFFIAGAFAARYPDIVARIAEEGHELANHSYTHPDYRKLSEAEMRSETRRGTAAIEAAAGVRIAPLWRPPFGGRDDRVLRVVEEEGFRSIYWTFDSGDWIEGATTDRVRSAVLRQAVAGAVVVHHVSPNATAQAMPDIIDELRSRGFDLVTVSEIIGP